MSQTTAKVPPVGDPEDIEDVEPPAKIKDLMINYKLFMKNSVVSTSSLISPLRSLIHNVRQKVTVPKYARIPS
jgi:hypothetical protein